MRIMENFYLESKKFLSNDTAVVLLYNCVKILLGVDTIPESLKGSIQNLLKKFGMDYSANYGENVIQLFFIIKIFIFKKPEFKRALKSPTFSK